MEKKKKKYWLIPLILGIAIGIYGVVTFVQAQNMEVPNMSSPFWFDASVQQERKIASAVGLIFFGFVFLSIFGTIITATLTSAFSKHKEIKKTFPDPMSIISSVTSAMGVHTATVEEKPAPKRYCTYCGSEIEEGKSSCSGCGSKSFK